MVHVQLHKATCSLPAAITRAINFAPPHSLVSVEEHHVMTQKINNSWVGD